MKNRDYFITITAVVILVVLALALALYSDIGAAEDPQTSLGAGLEHNNLRTSPKINLPLVYKWQGPTATPTSTPRPTPSPAPTQDPLETPTPDADIVDVRVASWVTDWQVWCWMADISCLRDELDPEYIYTPPEGYIVDSVTVFSYTDEERGNYFGSNRDGLGCVYWMPPGQVCFEVAGDRARVYRSDDFSWTIDVLQVHLLKRD